MLKRQERLVATFQKFVDGAAVALSWLLAYQLRFKIVPGGQQGDGVPLIFLKFGLLLICLSLFFFKKNKLYKSHRFSSRYKEISAVLKSNTQSILCFVLILYFFNQEKVSRIAIISYLGISSFILVALRLSIRNLLRMIRRNGRNLRHAILVGSGTQMGPYINTLRSFKDSGVRVAGWIDSEGMNQEFNIPALELTLDEAILKYNPDSIIVGYSGDKAGKIEEIVKNYHNDLVPIQILPNITYSFIGYHIEEFEGIPILTLNQPKLDTADYLIKRTFDLFFSFVGLIILSPLLFLISLMVKLSSKGPIFYGQERMGVNGDSFKMWKFRSMKVATGNDDTKEWSNKENPRKTKIGSFLRQTSLDELPQLWNVLVGEMSLVGPRPEQPYFVGKFKDEIPAYMLRHKMKAGITGWAQINGWRGDTSLHKRIECDIYYIKNWSFWLDIKIIFLTFWKGFINKNAY